MKKILSVYWFSATLLKSTHATVNEFDKGLRLDFLLLPSFNFQGKCFHI